VDLWMPWISPILSLGSSPHLVLSWIFLILTVVALMLACERHAWRWSAIAGLSAAILLNFHPYHWPTLFAVPVFWFGLRWVATGKPPYRTIPYMLPLVLGAVISLGYHQWLLQSSPVIAFRSLQNIARLPPWPYVAAGFGVVLPLALVGVLNFRRTIGERGWWVLAWLLAGAALMFWPSQFQARYIQGLLIPLAIMAADPLARGFQSITRRLGAAGGIAAGAVLAVLAFGSPVGLVAHDIRYYRSLPSSFYFPAEFFDAAGYLAAHAKPGDITLASHDSGLFLAGYAGRTLYFGHGDETVDSAKKRAEVERFYRESDPAARQQFLSEKKIRYVWSGWFERQLSGPRLDNVPGLFAVYVNPAITIYRVE
ncbi:MAG: hypothetical protein PHI63_06020, partial [Patescibacteria group bacterium]|nr:hypothetical protein [Patescibacteria group bacterium]